MTQSAPSAVKTIGLTKRFGPVLAVDHVDLDVRAGGIYGFLGANGSGKTTTVRMLLGLVLATEGSVELLGHAIPDHSHAALADVGALIEGPAAYGHLSGRENLAVLDASGPNPGRDTRRRRIDDALEQVGLGGVGRRHVRGYSLGMRQRLGLAAALMNRPSLLILDEPTNGLDPQGIRDIRTLLLGLHAAGSTIFLSSHLLAEVEQLCTRVGVLDRGRLVLEEDVDVLRAPTGRILVRTTDPAAAVRTLDGRVADRDGDRLIIRCGDPAEVNVLLVEAGIGVTELVPERPTLEAVILARTGPGSDPIEAAP